MHPAEASREDPALECHLRATEFIDSDHPEVVAFARDRAAGATTPREKAILLYYAVRDEFRYDPYRVVLRPEHFRASACIDRGHGFCITKAVLLTACLRAERVPARLGFGDVRNHLATERLLEYNGGDLFVYHGYADVKLGTRWVKATPAFNLSLCEKFGVESLEFDGVEDSLFHPHDKAGRRHMEYVRDRGVHDDLPYADIEAAFRRSQPKIFGADEAGVLGGDFHAEAAAGATD